MRITISIDEETKGLLDNESERTGVSISAFIRLAVRNQIQGRVIPIEQSASSGRFEVKEIAETLTPPPKTSIKDLPGFIDHSPFGHKEPGMIQNNQVIPRAVNPEATPDNWEKGDYSEKSIELD